MDVDTDAANLTANFKLVDLSPEEIQELIAVDKTAHFRGTNSCCKSD